MVTLPRPMTAISPDDPPLPCPRCGYDLRGNETGVCPECGEAFDAATLTTAAIPWQNRREVGRFRAFVRTVWLALRRPRELARQAARPVDYGDARRFQLVCVALAWLGVAPPAGYWLWSNLRLFVEVSGGGSGLAGRFADAAVILALVAGLFLFLLTATGVAGYFFHPRGLAVELQDRALALSYYAAAPLSLLPAAAALGLAVIPALTRGAPTFQKSPLVFLAQTLGTLPLCVVAVVAAADLFVLPLVLLGVGVRASVGRLCLCGVTLLLAWPVLFAVFALGPPLLVFYAELVWQALR